MKLCSDCILPVLHGSDICEGCYKSDLFTPSKYAHPCGMKSCGFVNWRGGKKVCLGCSMNPNLIKKEEIVMNRIHTTKEGDSMMICQMTDSHLIATIKLMCKGIEELRTAIDCGDQIKRSEKVIYNQKKVSIESLEGILKGKIGLLKEYTVESALRGLNVSEYMQKGFGRKNQLTIGGNILSLDVHVDAKEEKDVVW